jgi:hypothetical protein
LVLDFIRPNLYELSGYLLSEAINAALLIRARGLAPIFGPAAMRPFGLG